jgi:hypothetical protein
MLLLMHANCMASVWSWADNSREGDAGSDGTAQLRHVWHTAKAEVLLDGQHSLLNDAVLLHVVDDVDDVDGATQAPLDSRASHLQRPQCFSEVLDGKAAHPLCQLIIWLARIEDEKEFRIMEEVVNVGSGLIQLSAQLEGIRSGHGSATSKQASRM